jgi:hypothetical protein
MKKLIIPLILKKNANFFRRKLGIIAENCDHNIDPRRKGCSGNTRAQKRPFRIFKTEIGLVPSNGFVGSLSANQEHFGNHRLQWVLFPEAGSKDVYSAKISES